MKRVRLSTLMLLIVIAALGVRSTPVEMRRPFMATRIEQRGEFPQWAVKARNVATLK